MSLAQPLALWLDRIHREPVTLKMSEYEGHQQAWIGDQSANRIMVV